MCTQRIERGASKEQYTKAKVEPRQVITSFPIDGTLRQIIFQELFRGPCKCCGNQAHGLLHAELDTLGQERISLGCMIADGQNWEDILQRALRGMDIKANPRQFAGCYSKGTAEAIGNFRRYGQGKRMDYMPLVDFENDVYRFIAEANPNLQRNGGFTRRVIGILNYEI